MARVAVTGIGIICGLAESRDLVFARLLRGETGEGRPTLMRRLAEDCKLPQVSEVKRTDEELAGLVRQLALPYPPSRILSRADKMTLISVAEALSDAGYHAEKLAHVDRRRIGIFGGSSLTGTTDVESYYRDYLRTGKAGQRYLLLSGDFGAPLDHVAQAFGIEGPRFMVSTACSSSTAVMKLAKLFLDSGELDVAVVVGVDPICEISLAGFMSLKVTAAAKTSPFSEGDYGLMLGEGAAALVLASVTENYRSYATLHGVGLSSDGYHATAPDPRGAGAKRAMLIARAESPDAPKPQLVLAHGTGTQLNDAAETLAIVAAVDATPKTVSTKAQTGHTLGAAGALNAALAALALERQVVLPTVNFTAPRKGCTLDYNPGTSQKWRIDTALANSFGFGGNNASCLLGRCVDQASGSAKRSTPVAITGFGVHTPFGIAFAELERAILMGTTALKPQAPVTSFSRKRQSKLSASVDFSVGAKDFQAVIRRLKNARKMDRSSLMVNVAITQLLQQASFKVSLKNRERVALIVGTGSGPLGALEQFYRQVVAEGIDKGNANLFPNTVLNACLGYATIEHMIHGPTLAISEVEASGALALDVAARLLHDPSSHVDAAVTGGVDEYSEVFEQALLELGHIPDDASALGKSQPLAADSQGYRLGECAVSVLLEREVDANSRGAVILARLMQTFISGRNRPGAARLGNGDGLADVLAQASARFGAPDLIVSNASGLRPFDSMIVLAIEATGLAGTPHYSPLQLFGNVKGSSALLGVAAAVTAIREQQRPVIGGPAVPASIKTVFVVTQKVGGLAVLNVVQQGNA
jgi:3-oxoacyl-[acyl-carrier-protein] synthase II